MMVHSIPFLQKYHFIIYGKTRLQWHFHLPEVRSKVSEAQCKELCDMSYLNITPVILRVKEACGEGFGKQDEGGTAALWV